MSDKEIQTQNAELSTAFNNRGVTGVTKYVMEKLDKWRNETLNIAVIGRAGVGKSNFINAIRDDLQNDSPLYAPVGHRETTKEAKPYPHPTNKNLVLWDLPGMGTDTFPKETYKSDKRINFHLYDVFLILTADRFLKDDKWLIEEIIKSGKLFLFLRTKMDAELDSDRKRLKLKANPEKVLKEIRDDCMKNIKEINGVSDTFSDLYLIGSLDIANTLLDFDKLVERIIRGLPRLKNEVLIFSLENKTPSLLKAKKQALSGRIRKVSILSACGGAVPIPGLSMACDIAIIIKEVNFYREQFGLRPDDLKILAKSFGFPEDIFIQTYDLKTFAMDWTARGIIAFGSLLASEAAEGQAKFALPVIGSLISGVLSFASTYRILHHILDTMMRDAEKINSILQDHTRSNNADVI